MFNVFVEIFGEWLKGITTTEHLVELEEQILTFLPAVLGLNACTKLVPHGIENGVVRFEHGDESVANNLVEGTGESWLAYCTSQISADLCEREQAKRKAYRWPF